MDRLQQALNELDAATTALDDTLDAYTAAQQAIADAIEAAGAAARDANRDVLEAHNLADSAYAACRKQVEALALAAYEQNGDTGNKRVQAVRRKKHAVIDVAAAAAWAAEHRAWNAITVKAGAIAKVCDALNEAPEFLETTESLSFRVKGK